MRKSDVSYTGWYFLLVVLLIYMVTYFLRPEVMLPSLLFFVNIIKSVIPVFVIVFLTMFLTNYLVKPDKLVKYLGEKSGLKGWLLAIVSGIISTGPIYMWYPLLNDLQRAGMRDGLIAVFLYNRAVKLALLPLIILYFGITYTIVLTVVMIFASVLQGIIVEKIKIKTEGIK